MTLTQKQAHSAHLQLIPLSIPPPALRDDKKTEIARLPFLDAVIIKALPPLNLPSLELPSPIVFNKRCKVKGCVFEVAAGAQGICWIHALWEKEPEKFQTRQPTHHVLEMAKYAITTEDEDTRIRQIIRAKATRRAFLEGVA